MTSPVSGIFSNISDISVNHIYKVQNDAVEAAHPNRALRRSDTIPIPFHINHDIFPYFVQRTKTDSESPNKKPLTHMNQHVQRRIEGDLGLLSF